MAKTEPLMAQEKVVNDDGTPSDYLIRYLRTAIGSGQSTVKFPVTSVNGKTGDVIIDLDSILSEGGIDYDKLNEKLQELIAGLDQIRQDVAQKFQDHITDYHKYSFQGFTSKNFGDERTTTPMHKMMFTLGDSNITSDSYSRSGTTVTLYLISSSSARFMKVDEYFYLYGATGTNSDIYNGRHKITSVSSGYHCQITFEISSAVDTGGKATDYLYMILDYGPDTGGSLYIPNLVNTASSYPAYFGSTVRSGISYFTTALRNHTTLSLFSIERTINIQRILIEIGLSGGSGTALNGTGNTSGGVNYTEYQFAIYKADVIEGLFGRADDAGDPSGKALVRFPNALIWSSEILSTDSITTWPNVVSRYAFDGTPLYTGFQSVLSWDHNTTLTRGVYFLGIRKYIHGNGYGTGTDGIQNIGLASAVRGNSASVSSAQWNKDSSQSLSLIQNRFQVAPTSGRMEGISFLAASEVSSSTWMEFYDTSNDGTSIREFQQSMVLNINKSGTNSPTRRLYLGAGNASNELIDNAFNAVDSGIIQSMSMGSYDLGGVAFKYIMADQQPSDTW